MSYHTPGRHGQAKPQNGTANQATPHHGIAHHTKTSHRMAWPSHRTVQHATSIYSIPPIETSVAKRKEGYDAVFAVTSGASGRYSHFVGRRVFPGLLNLLVVCVVGDNVGNGVDGASPDSTPPCIPAELLPTDMHSSKLQCSLINSAKFTSQHAFKESNSFAEVSMMPPQGGGPLQSLTH